MGKRAMPVRTIMVPLKDEWDGWELTVRSNPPMRPFLTGAEALKGAIADKGNINLSAAIPALYGMLELSILSWNFVDEQGEPLPANTEGVAKLPFDLLLVVCEAVVDAVVTIPKAPEQPLPKA